MVQPVHAALNARSPIGQSGKCVRHKAKERTVNTVASPIVARVSVGDSRADQLGLSGERLHVSLPETCGDFGIHVCLSR